MGLTNKSVGLSLIENELIIEKEHPNDKVIALGGNPNVGKSTIFNSLTGLNQHTGNWPGKTVANAQGRYSYKSNDFILVDIPGTYSLMANSVEEQVARDFICFGNPDATVIILDATCLERNLNLVLQTIEITDKVIVCVNLMDEAKRKNIKIDLEKLSNILGVPVVGTSATKGVGLENLIIEIHDVAYDKIKTYPIKIKYDNLIEKHISKLERVLDKYVNISINNRWIALKLLEGEETLLDSLNNYIGLDIQDIEELYDCLQEIKDDLNKEGIDRDVFRDKIVTNLVKKAEIIADKVVSVDDINYNNLDRRIDKYLTSKRYGIPIMVLLLAIVFWITLTGANYPSQVIAKVLFWIEDRLNSLLFSIGTPTWIQGLFVSGIYRTLAWVVSVMLPPMAIFFPLFTLLEDLGYLPRVAFNLDNFFKKSSSCGKQALTMCMGFGCNAAGIIGCRIIDSPRERLIAIITNNFVPCNGRFPTLIAIITMFFTGMFLGPMQSIISTLLLTSTILLGVFMTLFVSKLLSKTILKGLPSSFTLELPPYRKPQVGKIIIRSIFDRTLFVLGRAVVVAAPAGMIIWLMANINIGSISILSHSANFLDPFAKLIGLDGYILMAFILGFPANEIVIPIIIMSYLSTGNILELNSLSELKGLLVDNGWTWVTAISVMLFSLMHWPCATTCLTIKKETQSFKWTLVSFIVPTLAGIVVCFLFANTVRLFGLL